MPETSEARKLYPDWEEGYGPSDYSPILKSFGEIAVEVSDDDYQGDTRVLYRDGKRWGWLRFGWGSCSGCDALQACDTLAELDELIADLRSSIRWFDDAESAAKFFREHDWKGDYRWDKEDKQFVRESLAALGDCGGKHASE